MARVLGLFPAALNAAREGMSANQFYRELRDLGIAPRRSEALELYKISSNIVARSGDAVFRDPRSRPTGDDLLDWPTRKATGIRQNVTLVYRDRVTGKQLTTYYSYKSERGVRRETAMAIAIGAYASHADRYGQDLIGAVHTSSYRNVPFGV